MKKNLLVSEPAQSLVSPSIDTRPRWYRKEASRTPAESVGAVDEKPARRIKAYERESA